MTPPHIFYPGDNRNGLRGAAYLAALGQRLRAIRAPGPVVKLLWQVSNGLIFVIPAGAGAGIAC